MTADERLASRVRDATAAVLAELTMIHPKVQVSPRGDGVVPIFEVVVRAGSSEHRFTAGWAGKGWRPDIERLVAAATVQVVYARSLSDEAKDWLRDHRLGWVDETGAVSVALRSGLIVARAGASTGRPPSQGQGWTRTMLAAAEAILAGVSPTVEEVEEAAHIARGSSASALARLESQGLLERPGPKRGRGVSRRVVDMDTLIDRYTEAAGAFRGKQKVVRLHRLWSDPLQALTDEIGPALSSEGAQWAVTGAAASTLLAPYLADVTTLDLYVDRSLFVARTRLAVVLGGRLVDKGQRIEVREMPTAMSAQGPRIGGARVALPARVYADLVAAGGRAAEAAHHLREVRGVGPGA